MASINPELFLGMGATSSLYQICKFARREFSCGARFPETQVSVVLGTSSPIVGASAGRSRVRISNIVEEGWVEYVAVPDQAAVS